MLAHALALMSPGPDFVVCLRNSLNNGRAAGVYTALGFATGVGFHVLWLFAGMSYMLSSTEVILQVLQYAGAIYLMYLGVMGVVKKPVFSTVISKENKEGKPVNLLQNYRQGVITNFLNPKAVLFFLGLYTVLLSKNLAAVNFWVIGIGMVVLTAVWFSFVSVVLTNLKVRERLFSLLPTIHYASSIVLFLLGISIMFVNL